MITLRERGVHPESTVIETCKYLTALSPNQMTAIIMNKRLEGKQIWTGEKLCLLENEMIPNLSNFS